MSDKTESLRVIIFRDGNTWIAQALEIDICVQGDNLPAVKAHFLATLRAEVASGDIKKIGPAPSEFQEMWGRRSDFTWHSNKDNGVPVELAIAA